ncbi:MAG TPA: cytochrome c [Pseudolabrys sp.]|nr:cytochrome c [Pseudolabrys sp.]
MRFLALIGGLAIIVGIGAAVFFLGGFYSVAATAEDPGIVRWALIQVRTASINRHATEQPPANINDAQTVQAGAKAFATHGCANCHGAPGVPWQKYSEGLNPDPPDLKKVVDQQTPAQLFWVVKNGINMTGMPSFQLAGAKDEEIWAIAAFLKKLPTVSEADYKAWTSPPAPPPAAAPPPAPAPAAPPAAQPSPPASNN